MFTGSLTGLIGAKGTLGKVVLQSRPTTRRLRKQKGKKLQPAFLPTALVALDTPKSLFITALWSTPIIILLFLKIECPCYILMKNIMETNDMYVFKYNNHSTKL